MRASDVTTKSDEEIVALVDTDHAFFGVLVERYEAALLRYVRRLLAVSREDAEDIVQEVFLKAYRNLSDFDPALSFSSWLYRIAHNTARSAWRAHRARPQGHTVEVSDAFWERIVADDDMARALERTMDARRVRAVFAQMDEKYRNVLVLHYMEEKSYREIADIIKRPMGSVATLVHRAKKQFRALCERKA